MFASCGTNEAPVNPDTVLCRGESDVALRVLGGARPVDMCVDTEDVSATISNDIYEITVRVEQDSVIYELQMTFAHHDNFPVALNVTGDLGAALGDPNGAWLFYQEIPASGGAVESVAVSGGSFILGFSGRDVVTGTLAKVTFDMRDAATTSSAGTREISEGIFSILTDAQQTK